MPTSRIEPYRSSQGGGGSDYLAPLQLPFSVNSEGGQRPAAAGSQRSWGNRLGVWWDDAEEEGPGVVVTGLLPRGIAAKGGALQVGDVIVGIDGKPVSTLGDLTRHLDERGPGRVQLEVRASGSAESRPVGLPVPEEAFSDPGAAAPAQAGRPVNARVPLTDLLRSLTEYIQVVLSNPVQKEVTHPGVAADPEFGCLGADLSFSLQNVGLSDIRNAIVQNEPRLKDVDVESVDVEVREGGEYRTRPGIRVNARLAATGAAVKLEFEIEGVQRNRQVFRRRWRSDDAGVEQ